MTTKEFNILVNSILKERLISVGFKNQKNIFYIHQSPNIIVLLKHYYKEYFQGFYIGATNDFLSNVKNDSKELSLSPYLENYPFSISIEDLENQYQKFDRVVNFEYDTNFLTRAILPTRTDTNTVFSMYDKLKHDEHLTKTAVNSVAGKTVKYGLRLLDEYSPDISYRSVTRYKKAKDSTLAKFKVEIEKYCLDNNLKLNKPKRNWFSFLK